MAGEPVDALTVSNRLHETGKLEKVGGRAFIHSLTAEVYPVPNLPSYAGIVRHHARRREEARIGRELEAGILTAEAAGRALESLGARDVGAAPRLRFQTAQELTAVEGEEAPAAIVQNLLFEASLHDLVAKPKAGKTSFCLALTAAVLHGAPFLSRPTTKTAAVYLTEERRPSFRDALGRVGLLGHPDLHLLLRQDAFGVPWPDVMAEATARALQVGAGLLIVDTLGDWASLVGDDENSAGATLEAMRPMQRAAAAGLCVLLSRHDKKGPASELGEAGRGSNAISGAADVLLGLRRSPGQGHETRRELAVVGRFNGLPPLLVLEWRGDGYVSLGEHSDVEFREMQTRILDHLPPVASEGLREEDLLVSIREADPGASRSTLKRALKAMEAADEVRRSGEGRRGSPFVYSLSRKDCGHVSL